MWIYLASLSWSSVIKIPGRRTLHSKRCLTWHYCSKSLVNLTSITSEFPSNVIPRAVWIISLSPGGSSVSPPSPFTKRAYSDTNNIHHQRLALLFCFVCLLSTIMLGMHTPSILICSGMSYTVMPRYTVHIILYATIITAPRGFQWNTLWTIVTKSAHEQTSSGEGANFPM